MHIFMLVNINIKYYFQVVTIIKPAFIFKTKTILSFMDL